MSMDYILWIGERPLIMAVDSAASAKSFIGLRQHRPGTSSLILRAPTFFNKDWSFLLVSLPMFLRLTTLDCVLLPVLIKSSLSCRKLCLLQGLLVHSMEFRRFTQAVVMFLRNFHVRIALTLILDFNLIVMQGGCTHGPIIEWPS